MRETERMRRTPRPLVAGNWNIAWFETLAQARASDSQVARQILPGNCDVMICPPATLLRPMKEAIQTSRLKLGGQDCHASSQGAHTGEVSAEMLKDAGATAVIVGHSERREDHQETNMDVRAKAAAAHRAGLIAIICVGETFKQRKAGLALRRCWAPVERLAARNGDGQEHGYCVRARVGHWGPARPRRWRMWLRFTATFGKRLGVLMSDGSADQVRLLYGGSVKPSNAAELLATENVDGAFGGGSQLGC